MKTRELKREMELQRQSLCDLELLRSIFLRTFMKYLPMINCVKPLTAASLKGIKFG
jgi:hypothetical protein